MLHKNFSQTKSIWHQQETHSSGLYCISPSLPMHKHIHTRGPVSCCSQIPIPTAPAHLPMSHLTSTCAGEQGRAVPCTTSPTALPLKKGVSQGTCRLWAIFNSHKHTKFKTQLTSNSGVVGLRTKYFLHIKKKIDHTLQVFTCSAK